MAFPIFSDNMDRTLNIMLVDDEPAVTRVVKKILMKQGHTVFDFLSGEDAIDAYQTLGHIDLVVCDASMPTPGSEVYRRINGHDKKPHFCFISGYRITEFPVIETIVNAGAASFIQKPFSPDKLVDAVNAFYR